MLLVTLPEGARLHIHHAANNFVAEAPGPIGLVLNHVGKAVVVAKVHVEVGQPFRHVGPYLAVLDPGVCIFQRTFVMELNSSP